MNKINQKEMLDIFSNRLQQNFEDYCGNCHIPENLPNFVTYLIDREIIHPGVIRKYTIREAFHELHKREKMGKTQVVKLLAKRFKVSRRTVWNVLKAECQ
jgi:hypothetical protein